MTAHPTHRWFRLGLRFFAAGAAIAALATALLWLPQMRVLAAVALVQALLGVGICAWGLRSAPHADADGIAGDARDPSSAHAHPKGRWHPKRLMQMIAS